MAFVSGQIWQRAGKAAETASGGKNYPNQEMKIIKLFQFIQIRR